MASDTHTAYLAPEGYETQLESELSAVTARYGRLFLCDGGPQTAYWAQNTWFDPRIIEIQSIGDGAKKLKAIQRNWANYAFDMHRRSALLQDKLPHVSAKPLVFPALPPDSPLGSWTMIDKNTILASPTCSSPRPNGAFLFEEDKEGPPNRAYLKLWEGLTRVAMMPGGKMPGPGDTCLDLGACPGGWTWVLQKLGCNVIAVDKAPLDPSISALPNVDYRQDSAFALEPSELPPVDWLFSDIICYPDRLLKLVEKWRGNSSHNMLCTIKFQSGADYSILEEFAAVPGSTLVHLFHNKHELTFIKLAGKDKD